MSINVIIVVEDKPEEQQNALSAIKRAIVPEGDDEMNGSIRKDAPTLLFPKAKLIVHFAPTLELARLRLDLAKEFSKKFSVFES